MPRLLLVAGAAVILMAMTGCVDPAPPVTSSPTPSATPVFASEEEALAAAEAAYREYLAVSDLIFSEGGVNPDRLQTVATGDFLEVSLTGFEDVQANGWHSTGHSAVVSAELQAIQAVGPTDVVTIYLCDDVSGVDVLDASGSSVVSENRPNRTLFQVNFDLEVSSGRLLVSNREVWGDGRC